MKGKNNKNGKPHPNSGRGNRKRRDEYYRRDKESGECREDSGSARNDISWYSKYPNLLQAAGSFPYPYRPGMSLPLESYNLKATSSSSVVSYKRTYNIPGVLSFEWMPSVGVSKEATDPASVLAKELYAKVREAYSGSLDADAPDFVIYLMALDSIFAYIAWLKRLYRVLTAWSPENYVLPDRLLNAMGLNNEEINSLRENKVQLWQNINDLILQSRKFTCPAIMDIFNRHYWMSDNVYTDDSMINSQLYLFNLKAVLKYQLNESEQVGMLVATKMPWVRDDPSIAVPPISTSVLYNFGLGLINALVSWDDAYTINGYLRRAFDGVPTFIIDELPQNQPFNPVYEPEVLMQIENARALPGGEYAFRGVSYNFNISQNPATNAIISEPSYTLGGPNGSSNSPDDYNLWTLEGNLPPAWITIRSQSPTVADNVVATRLQSFGDVSVDTLTTPTQSVITVRCATEILFDMVYYDGSNNFWGAPTISVPGLYGGYIIPSVANFSATASTRKVSLLFFTHYLSAFDWHPVCCYSMVTSDTNQVASTVMVGDIHNMTIVSDKDIDNLHRVCIYSELSAFSIP